MNSDQQFNQYLKKTTKEAGFVFITRVFAYLVGLGTSIVYARILGADLYGVFQLAITVISSLMIFTIFGMSSGLVRFIPIYESSEDKEKLKGTINFSIFLGILTSIFLGFLLFLFRNTIAFKLFQEPRLATILPVFSIILIFYTVIMLFGAIIQANKKYSVFVLYKEIVERLSAVLIFLVFVFILSNKLFAITWAKFLAAIIVLVLTGKWILKQYPILFKKPILPRINRREFIVYSSNLMFISFTYFLMGQVNRLIVGAYASSKEVAYYSVGMVISGFVIFILTSFNSIFAPIISELYHKKEYGTLRRMYSTLTRLIWVFTLPIFLWIVVFSRRILLFYGHEFTQAEWVLIFLAMGQFVNAAVGPNGLMLSMSGHQKWEMFNGIAVATLNVVLNILLVPRYGATGSAIAGSAALTLVNIIKSIEVWVVMGMIPYNLKFIKPIISGITGFVVLYILRHLFTPGFVYTLFAFAIGVIVILGVSFLLGLEEEDKMLLRTIRRKIWKA